MPHEFPLFADLLVLLLISVPIAFICHRLRLPSRVCGHRERTPPHAQPRRSGAGVLRWRPHWPRSRA